MSASADARKRRHFCARKSRGLEQTSSIQKLLTGQTPTKAQEEGVVPKWEDSLHTLAQEQKTLFARHIYRLLQTLFLHFLPQ